MPTRISVGVGNHPCFVTIIATVKSQIFPYTRLVFSFYNYFLAHLSIN